MNQFYMALNFIFWRRKTRKFKLLGHPNNFSTLDPPILNIFFSFVCIFKTELGLHFCKFYVRCRVSDLPIPA